MKPFARAVAGAVVSLVGAQVAHAGTAYIPLPGISAVGPVTYKTQIEITNTAGETLAVDSLQLAPGVDGTRREGRAATRLSILTRTPAACWSSKASPACATAPGWWAATGSASSCR